MADEVESEKIEGKVVYKLSLSHSPLSYGSMLWSCDDRISVVTDQCVYVITLLFAEESIKSNLKHYISYIPANEEGFTIATGGSNNFELIKQTSSNLTIKRLLDTTANPPKTTGVNYTSYTSVAWSPSGCDQYGRCIIATLCLDHRLSLYTSNKIHEKWKEIFCISDKWHSKCKPFFDPKVKKLKKGNKLTKHMTSESRTTEIAKLEIDYTDIVAFTAIDWSPVLLDISNKNSNKTTNSQKYALLAAATKNGNVTFWKVAVPLPDDNAEVQQVDRNIQTGVHLPCSIAWLGSDACKGDTKGLLAVGGSNGQIEVFDIKVSKDSNITINSTSKHMLWKECDDLAVNRLCWTYDSKNQSSFATLSASKGSAVVQFSVPCSEEGDLEGSRHHIYDGLHSAFITGMGVSQNGRVVTCDSDGALQMIDDGSSSKVITNEYKPSYSCNGLAVSPNGLYTALLHTPNISSMQIQRGKNRQVKISMLSLFSEEVLSNVVTQTSLATLWDVQTAICQHHTQNGPLKQGPVIDFLNQTLDRISFLSLYVRHRLVDQFAKSSDSDSFTSEDVEAELNIRDWKLETTETGQQIVRLCLTKSLELWLKNDRECEPTDKARTSLLIMSDWLVMNYNDQDSLDLAVRVYKDTGDTGSAALASSIRDNMLGNGMIVRNPLKQDQVVKQEAVVVDLNQNGSLSNKTTLLSEKNKLPCREKCQICQADIPLNSFITGKCANGHAWKRCLATVCVCADYMYQRCQDCGGCISLIGQEKSPWLQNLLMETHFCSLCHGWKDSRG